MDLLILILYFIVFSNIVLLFSLNFKSIPLKENRILLVLFSYGLAPMLVGLIFYYSVFLFPQKEDWFYCSIILLFFALLLVFSRKNSSQWIEINKSVILGWKALFLKNFKSKLWLVFVLLFFFFIGAQALFYPAIGDQAVYINQGKAVYEYKTDIQKMETIVTEQRNEARYNSAVRPGLPFYFASTFLFRPYSSDSSSTNDHYFLFKVLSFYYYILLFILFLYVVRIKKKNLLCLSLGTIVFFFYWIFTRMAIFNSKETAIYFFALLSLIFLYLIFNKKDKKNFSLEILLGITLGLNVFINVHGMVIFILIALILFIFENRPLRYKLVQFLIISPFLLIFSAFDFLTMFKAIFGTPIKLAIYSLARPINSLCQKVFHVNWGFLASIPEQKGSYFELQDKVHKTLYGMNSLSDLYLKGKLQIFTNFGYYAFLGWLFIISLVLYFKKIWANKFLKVVLIFIALYFLVVIDPFNLSRHPNGIVLSGSPKYSSLIVFLGIVIFINYLPDLLDRITKFFFKFRVIIGRLLIATFLFLLFFKGTIVNFIVVNLDLITVLYKSLDFYQQKITLFYNVLLIFIFLLAFLLLLKAKYLKERSKYLLKFLIIVMFLVAPFFLFEPGKTPLKRTFTDIGKSNEYKLRNDLIYSDFFNLFYDAQKILPPDTQIVTENYDIIIYNDFFQLTNYEPKEKVHYKIGSQCDPQTMDTLLKRGEAYLCRIK